MTTYLKYRFDDDEKFLDTFDELPLWSASFGLLLLKHLELKKGQTIIDIGSGTGFPLMEIAARAGGTCTVYGIDPWKNANQRARQKMKNYGLTNVEIIEQSAENIPLDDNSVDLIVSNLGINNFEQPGAVFKAGYRVLKPGGKLALTTNLNGHWKEFYTLLKQTLVMIGKADLLEKVIQDEERRGTTGTISRQFTDSGFKVTRCFEEQFNMKFLDGTAFLNHHFIKLGWLGGWKTLFPREDLFPIFTALEQTLNAYAEVHNGLKLTIPMAFIEGEKATGQTTI